jgi:thiamine transport system substrate-binding protein
VNSSLSTPKMSVRAAIVLLIVSLIVASCGGSDDTDLSRADDASTETERPTAAPVDVAELDTEATGEEPDAPAVVFANEECESTTSIRLATYDSFVVSEGVFEAFTAETCIEVEQVAAGDAGQLVSSAILTKDNPTADVMFGIDNTFLQRGLDAELFLPYASPLLAAVDAALQLDPENRVTPIDYGDVCVNYWIDQLPGDTPAILDDLIDPVNADQFVTMNPETSSPGFAFLLATIARYGDGWEDYWQSLVDNGVSITAGWSDAYYGEYRAGGGSRSIVTSYASSPPAEVIFADPPVDTAPSAVLYDSCFRQVEFAGVLAGTKHVDEAQQLIDFMLSTTFQEDIPLNMFVYPANSEAALPEAFVEFGQLADNPATLSPQEIEANRESWTERWVEIVLG